MATIPVYLLRESHHIPTILDYVPKNFKLTGRRPSKSSPAMDYAPSQEPRGRADTTSTADSVVEVQEERPPKKEALYGDIQTYLTEQQKYWLLARDVELARPLQAKYGAYEADIMVEIRKIEDERVREFNRRWREMRGATGATRISWKLYKFRVKLCTRWNHYQLHCRWKRGQLKAKKKELVEEYVRAQVAGRMSLLRDIIRYADEQAVDDRDDGGYVRDGTLNYIMTGYDSLFPISREL